MAMYEELHHSEYYETLYNRVLTVIVDRGNAFLGRDLKNNNIIEYNKNPAESKLHMIVKRINYLLKNPE